MNDQKPDPTRGVEKDSPNANLTAMYPDDGVGTPSVFACPDCQGVLWELQDGNLLRFRCRVGHAYTAETLLEEFQRNSEDLLWAGMRGLHELGALEERLSRESDPERARSLRTRAEVSRANAGIVLDLIENEGQPPSGASSKVK